MLFDGLKIMQEKSPCEKYMGKFPVISISLKSVDGLKYDSAVAALRTVIGNEAGRFRFLRESPKLDEDDRNSYNQLVNVEAKSNSKYAMSDDVSIDSLKTLALLLEKHYGQKVILLIDEYDVPLDKAFQAGYYNEMVKSHPQSVGQCAENQRQPILCRTDGMSVDLQREYLYRTEQPEGTHTSSVHRYDAMSVSSSSFQPEILHRFNPKYSV